MTYEEDVVELWKTIEERLSPSEVKTCKSLLEDLKSHRSKASQVHTSLRRLFKKDEDLYHRCTQLFPYSDNQEDKDGKTQDDVEDTDNEEGGIREEEDHHQAHIDIKKKKKIDQDVAMANHEIRVKVDQKPKEKDVTIVSPSYELLTIPEEKEESVLNNKYIQIEVGTSGSKKLTPQQKAVAKCEDEMYEAERLITAVENAVKSVEKVMSGKMGMEALGPRFYKCIKETLRRNVVNQIDLPRILDRLKKKLDDRNRKTPGWKKVLEENSTTAQGHKKK